MSVNPAWRECFLTLSGHFRCLNICPLGAAGSVVTSEHMEGTAFDWDLPAVLGSCPAFHTVSDSACLGGKRNDHGSLCRCSPQPSASCCLLSGLWFPIGQCGPRCLGRYGGTSYNPVCRAHLWFSASPGPVMESAWLRDPPSGLCLPISVGCQFCSGLLSLAHSLSIMLRGSCCR